MMEELTARQEMILGLVVREYVEHRSPTGSGHLVSEYNLGISAATVRAEMAQLEDLGYLYHPHTSAGRAPTELGYRYFVRRLVKGSELPEHERRMIRHQFHQARLDMDQWMLLAAAVLAQTAQSASLVTTPHMIRSRFKHVELIATQGRLVLLVLVLESGQVLQQMLTLAQPLSQAELSEYADRINQLCYGLSAIEIASMLSGMAVLENEVSTLIYDVMSRSDSQVTGKIYRDGLTHLVTTPDSEDTLHGVRILEEKSLLEDVLDTSLRTTEPIRDTGGGSVQVVIAGEGKWEELRDWSVVLARYGLPDYAVGVVGLLGPTHMRYSRAISTVRYVAGLMSGLMYRVLGADELN
ncbi:MAG: heat-inducible transcriptional repressor HrcA [Chloroflexota bacterium]